MRGAWPAAIAVCALAGCSSLPDDATDCTNIISLGGGLLKFCQSHQQLDIYETAVAEPLDIQSVRVIDDPTALKTLQADLHLRNAYRRSRQLIAKACVVDDDTYISMRVHDLKRILARRRRAHLFAPEAPAPFEAPDEPRPMP